MILQNNLNLDVDTCRKILELFHPDVKIDDEKLSKICKNGNYHWVTIEGNVKKYGRVSLTIDNKHDTNRLYGPGHSIETFIKLQPGLRLNIFRTSLDCKYNNNEDNTYDKELSAFVNHENYILRPRYSKILKDAGYETMNAQEWFHEYYKD